MNVLITGNLGYVGPILCKVLRNYYPSVNIVGYDSAFFANDLVDLEVSPEYLVDTQHYGDIRDINDVYLKGIDSIVHLAAVSNDPMGVEFENVTSEINRSASVRLVQMAVNAGVKNFVFASSCSMYGFSDGGARKETDITNPLTSYAKSKIGTEEDVKSISLGNMVFTSLRFATACGWSPRLRLDLVLNDFVASAISFSKAYGPFAFLSFMDVFCLCRARVPKVSSLRKNQ
jgi:nucleoside-diphosphate-sugar epimerase